MYCGLTCRRRAEALRAALTPMRVQLAWWQAMAAKHPRDEVYRFEANADELATQIAQFEAQLERPRTEAGDPTR